MPDIARLDELLASKLRLDAEAEKSPEIRQRLSELRRWQAARLARTYDDLRRDPRYAAAVEFFLTDLYGPQDFARRDADFTRAWSKLKRGLPDAALEVLGYALELQVLTAELDRAMVLQLGEAPLSGQSYADAYRAVGKPEARQRQIELVPLIGGILARIVTFPFIGLALRAAHIPAHLSGFGALQDFLERGFQAFRGVGNAPVMLEAIQSRETSLMNALFAGLYVLVRIFPEPPRPDANKDAGESSQEH